MEKRFIHLLGVVCGVFIIGVIVFSFVIFETNKPKIENDIPTHWNLKDNLSVILSDESGIKEYRLQVLLDGEIISDEKEVVLNKPKKLSIELTKPNTTLKNGTVIQYKLSATDWSNAHFFSGNTIKHSFELIVDTTPPRIQYIASSFRIARGGSAVVAFGIKDMAIKDIYISNGVDTFQAFEYGNAYISVIAWPMGNTAFNGQIIAIDKAGNEARYDLPMTKNIITYPRSVIALKETFLNGKLNELISQLDTKLIKDFDDDIERFKFFNQTIRQEDERKILQSSNIASNKSFIDNEFVAFEPLKNSKVVGGFGDFRSYYYKKEKISEATHLGLDIASVRNAPVFASNNGVIVLSKYLGLYGNTVLLYHGFGVSSIYSHLLESEVKVSQEIPKGTRIGRTGTSGWAFGDHLHFGILIQGHFVRLSEWLDSKWVNENVIAVLQKAKEYGLSQ